jgi:hypothetical protein
MEKIPTAEEFVQNFLLKNHKGNVGSNNEKLMIEFAKLHVEAALKEVINNVEIDDYDVHGQYSPSINENSILNSYPLDNIK